MSNDLYTYEYTCPICNEWIAITFYEEPDEDNTFTCDCGNDLMITAIDHEDKTMEVCDFYEHMDMVYEDYKDNH